MKALEKKVKNVEVENKSFNLSQIIQEHFIITDDYIYDHICVRPIKSLKKIEFYKDNYKSDKSRTVGLLKFSWKDCHDDYDIWYTLGCHTEYGIARTNLKCLD